MLVDAHKISITVKDINTLKGLNWLNDEIINFYMAMIVERASGDQGQFPSVHAFNTHFYQRLMKKGYTAVKRWTKNVDIFSFSLVIVPVPEVDGEGLHGRQEMASFLLLPAPVSVYFP